MDNVNHKYYNQNQINNNHKKLDYLLNKVANKNNLDNNWIANLENNKACIKHQQIIFLWYLIIINNNK